MRETRETKLKDNTHIIKGRTQGGKTNNMKTFVEITTLNTSCDSEETKAFIRTNDIVGIKQLHVEGKKLYDEDRNLVSEEPATEKQFQVLVINDKGTKEKFIINETEYTNLVKVLNE